MKIALIGSAPSSIRLAPYGSKDWQIWGCSPGVYGIAPRMDVWFELHRYEPGQPWLSPEYCQWMAKFPGPVFMNEPRPEIPNCVVLPWKPLVDKYGPYFFTSSLAWMFAMAIEAILEDRETREGNVQDSIGLWGVDMAATDEYGYQRAGCQFFAMLARSNGIEVGVPLESDLLRPSYLYGISELNHMRAKMRARRSELEARLANATNQVNASTQEAQFLRGALDDMSWSEGTWAGQSQDQQFLEPPVVPALTNFTFKAIPSVQRMEPKIKRKYKKKAKPNGQDGEARTSLEPVSP